MHGDLFHVVGRGLERRRIFNRDEDKEDFLLRLDVGLKKSGHACSEAKSLLAFFAFDALGMTTKAIANYLGMSHQGACDMVARGRAISWSKGITLESLSS